MTERSRFWTGTTVGDAVEAPYDAPIEFARVMGTLGGSDGFTGLSCIFPDVFGELAPSVAAPLVSIAAGRALVHGTWYEADAAVAISIPTPSGTTRTDRIVLRKDFVAQTVRVTRIAGTEGAGPPAMTRTVGTAWDMSICQVVITTSGAISQLDERVILQPWIPPGVMGIAVSGQVIAANTPTPLLFDSETYKTDTAMHNVGVNNSRLVCTRPGLYAVTAYVAVDFQPTNYNCTMSIRKNGAGTNMGPYLHFVQYIMTNAAGSYSAHPTIHQPYLEVTLVPGDYLEVMMSHDLAPSKTVFRDAGVHPTFGMRFIQSVQRRTGF